jgi:hypothetical protein
LLDCESPLADWLAGFFVLTFLFCLLLVSPLSARDKGMSPPSQASPISQARKHDQLFLRSRARTMPTSNMARARHSSRV